MQQEKSFLDALAADPFDDATRLVYSDWLDDQGDGRADFLRAEQRLAVLPETDPDLYPAEQECARIRRRLDPGWVEAVGRLWDLWLTYVLSQGKAEVVRALRKHFCGMTMMEEMTERRDRRRPGRCAPLPSRARAEVMVEQLPSYLRGGLTRAAAERLRSEFAREAFGWQDVPAEHFLPWVVIVPAARPSRRPCSPGSPERGHDLWLHGYDREHPGPIRLAIRAVTQWPAGQVMESLSRPVPWRVLEDVSLDQARRAARHFPAQTDLEVICRWSC
jgi:uncharacterized protein (TIGR02996 family)